MRRTFSPNSARAEAAQAVDDGCDAVGLLQPQLGGAAHQRLALGEAAEQGDERQLVDRQRHLVGLDHRAAERRVADVELGDRLGRPGCPSWGSSSGPTTTAPIRCAMRKKPTRVQLTATPSSTIREPGHEHRGGGVEGDRGGVAGDVDAVDLELVLRVHGQHVALALDAGAGLDQHALGVVAARPRLAHARHARGEQAGEQDAGLDLRRGDRQLVVGAGEAAAGDRQRGEAVLARVEPRAHLPQRLGDAVDRAAADRLVAVEHPDALGLAREPARQQPQQRAGVADVDRAGRLRGRAQPRAADQQVVGARLDDRAERLHRAQRRARVLGVEVAGDLHRVGGHRGEQRGAVRDRLVGRRGERAAQAGRWRGRRTSRPRHREAEAGDQALGLARVARRRRSTARSSRSCCRRRDRAPCRRC